MANSLKARDLRRDPRCALHTAISGPDAGAHGAAYVFTLDVESAASVAGRSSAAR
jgi:hypothetical protein